MSDAERQDEVSASIPPQEGEEGAEADRQDPFRFGWHSIDVELVKEFASKPLPQVPDEDLVKTAPPGFGPVDAIPVRSLTPAPPAAAPAPEIPGLTRASYWPALVLLLCAAGGVIYWAFQVTGAPAPHKAPVIETSIPATESPEAPETDDEPQPNEAQLPEPSDVEPPARPPKQVSPSTRPTARTRPAGTAPAKPAAPRAPANVAPPANVPADKAPPDAVSTEKPPAAQGTSPGSSPKIWFDLE